MPSFLESGFRIVFIGILHKYVRMIYPGIEVRAADAVQYAHASLPMGMAGVSVDFQPCAYTEMIHEHFVQVFSLAEENKY